MWDIVARSGTYVTSFNFEFLLMVVLEFEWSQKKAHSLRIHFSLVLGRQGPKNQLKNAVIKPIDILMSCDPIDRSTATLKTTKLLLQSAQAFLNLNLSFSTLN